MKIGRLTESPLQIAWGKAIRLKLNSPCPSYLCGEDCRQITKARPYSRLSRPIVCYPVATCALTAKYPRAPASKRTGICRTKNVSIYGKNPPTTQIVPNPRRSLRQRPFCAGHSLRYPYEFRKGGRPDWSPLQSSVFSVVRREGGRLTESPLRISSCVVISRSESAL